MYRLYWKSDTQEYIVREYIKKEGTLGLTLNPEADYFTDDLDDARMTLIAMSAGNNKKKTPLDNSVPFTEDALLIAAAPDLLKACRLILALDLNPGSNVPGYIVKLDPKAKEQIMKAIDKATRIDTTRPQMTNRERVVCLMIYDLGGARRSQIPFEYKMDLLQCVEKGFVEDKLLDFTFRESLKPGDDPKRFFIAEAYKNCTFMP